MNSADFYQKVRTMCKQHGIKVYQMEKEIGIADGSAKKWRGRFPSSETLIKLSDFFGVSIDALIGREPTEMLLPDERKLIALFREMNEAGKAYLMQTAEIAAKSYLKKSADISEA